MRKRFFLSAVIVLCICLCACSREEEGVPQEPEVQEEVIAEGSGNDAADDRRD